jgi:hypothetical protein
MGADLRDVSNRILAVVTTETVHLPPRDSIECLERVKRDIQKRIDALYDTIIDTDR